MSDDAADWKTEIMRLADLWRFAWKHDETDLQARAALEAKVKALCADYERRLDEQAHKFDAASVVQQQKLAGAQKDAERYRWLRVNVEKNEIVWAYRDAGLDRAIDAAIAANAFPESDSAP